MRVWVDGQCLQTASKVRGIGRYVSELLEEIASHHADVQILISFNAQMADSAILAREMVSDWITPENIHVWHGLSNSGEVREGRSARRVISEAALAHHVNTLAPDIALSVSPFEGFLDAAVPLLDTKLVSVPLAGIFYDAIPKRFSERYLKTAAQQSCYDRRLESYRHFAASLCISEFSKSEIDALLPGVASVNISSGLTKKLLHARHETTARTEFAQGQPYFLYVGSLDWRKNVEVVVDAFARLPVEVRKTHRFLIAGDHLHEQLRPLRERWRKAGLPPEQFVSTGTVADDELVALYKHAIALVQPSLMEGFGLTALEGIALNTPVVAARAGALPEVVGESDMLFDPADPAELAALLERIARSESYRTALMEQQRKRLDLFSWAKTAQSTIDTLQRIVDDRRQPAWSRERSRELIASRLSLPHKHISTAAMSFTLSEAPEPSGERRFLVDVTNTVKENEATGIQRVVRKIYQAMAEGDRPENQKILATYCDSANGWLETADDLGQPPTPGDAQRLMARAEDIVILLDSSWAYISEQARHLREFRLRGAEVVSCIQDLIPLMSSGFCFPGIPIVFNDWFRQTLSLSTAFMCSTEVGARQLYELLEAIEFPRKMKIGYWHLGADFSDAIAPENSDLQSGETRPMFLAVGTIEPRKGHSVLLDAFDALWEEGLDVQLVIIGKPGWEAEHVIARLKSHPEQSKRLIWKTGVGDAELAGHYQTCAALVMPSYDEGFGLPIVEAGRYGKPVIASDIDVFHEVGEDAVTKFFFPAGSRDGLSKTVKTFLAMPEAERSRTDARAEWPSWAESAASLKQVLTEGDWYRIYEPPPRSSTLGLYELGNIAMEGKLSDADRSSSLNLAEGPMPCNNDTAFRVIVRAENLSSKVWSSEGDQDDQVFLDAAFSIRTETCFPALHGTRRSHQPGYRSYSRRERCNIWPMRLRRTGRNAAAPIWNSSSAKANRTGLEKRSGLRSPEHPNGKSCLFATGQRSRLIDDRVETSDGPRRFKYDRARHVRCPRTGATRAHGRPRHPARLFRDPGWRRTAGADHDAGL